MGIFPPIHFAQLQYGFRFCFANILFSIILSFHSGSTATNAVDERISGVPFAAKDSHKAHIWNVTRNREFVWKAIYNYWCWSIGIRNAVRNLQNKNRVFSSMIQPPAGCTKYHWYFLLIHIMRYYTHIHTQGEGASNAHLHTQTHT